MKPPEDIVFTGKIGEIVHTTQPDGRVFERYRRAPGVRLVIVSPEGKILVAKERRQEVKGIDYRLPGGKVCDTAKEYAALRRSGTSIETAAVAAAIKEAREEVGLDVKNPQLITIATAGATVEWDLYYFKVTEYEESPDGPALEDGEDIEASWMKPDELSKLIHEGSMKEWRSVGILLAKVLN
jgi:8-oxo-dGTP pyrophosphatase MutT (NUDIX family)